MKLDRNVNPNKEGKYALIKVRKIKELSPENYVTVTEMLDFLHDHGVLQWGNECPDQQFFVMKYGDRFTAPALMAYSQSARLSACSPEFGNATHHSLLEYADQIQDEAIEAYQVGKKLPD
jgi:hypothetical protein